MDKVRVLIADDHQIIRQGLQAIFATEEGYEIVGEATDGKEALRQVESLQPDVILLDIRMPQLDGIAAARKVKERSRDTKILVLTTYETEEEIFAALDAGVDGFLLKDTLSEDLIKAVDAVRKGKSFLHPSIARKVLGELKGRPRAPYGLTPRELEVLQLMVDGLKNKEIAKTLWVSERTVKAIVGSILRKLNQSGRVEAVVFALKNRLVEPKEKDD